MSDYFQIIRLGEIDSTNTQAKILFQQGKILKPAVIVADTQTQGKGQLQTKWHDLPGQNILITLVLPDLNLHVSKFFLLNIISSLALHRLVSRFGCAAIKWPNDILLEEKKVAGILIENIIQGESMKVAFVGIGLNVNQLFWPAGLSAASLAGVFGAPLDRNKLLMELLENFHMLLQMMYLQRIQSEYYQALFGLNEWKMYRDSNDTFFAKINKVEDDGKLVLELQDGTLHSYRFKEVQWVQPQ